MTRTPDTDPHDETTQPFSSPGPGYDQLHPIDHDAMAPNPTSGDANSGDDDHVLTLGHPEEKTIIEASEINISCLKNTVTWSNIHNQVQCIENINLEVYSDNSTNTAFFRLYCDIRLKHNGSNNMQTIYLFIYPESIRTVAFKSNVDSLTRRSSLDFCMTRPPSLIVPRERILDCKPRAKGLFSLVHSLAEVVDFTIHLNSNNSTTILSCLERVAHIFSLPPNRPRTNQRYANISSLYAGRGGEIVNVSMAATRPLAEAGSLPSYNASAHGRTSRKRQRRDSSCSSSRSPAARDRMLHLLGSINTGINKIESQLDGMKSQLNGMECRLGQLESNVSALDFTRSPCRFGTEERAEVLEEIHEEIDDRTLDMKINCDEMLKDIEKDTTRAIVEMQEEVRDTLGQLEDGIEETTERLVTKGLRSKLSNASLRIDGTVFLDT